VVSQVIGQALQWDTWQTFDANTRYQPLALCHYGMAQRWLVVYSQAALERAEATLKKATQREDEAIQKQLFHLQAQRFCAPEAAHDALSTLAKRWKYHSIASYHLTDHKRYAGKGRPTPSTPLKALAWQIQVHVRVDDTMIEQAKQTQACYILGTNIDPSELHDTEVITAYKGQAHVEGGGSVSQRPTVFCLVVVCQKTQPH
jgi:transposase